AAASRPISCIIPGATSSIGTANSKRADRPRPMSLLRHLERCNRFDARRFRPLLFGERRIGLVRDDNATRLARFPDAFSVTDEAGRLLAGGGFDAVSDAVDRVVERLVAEGAVAKWRYESFAVAPVWGEPPLFKLDRGAVPFLGVRA